MSSTPRAGRIDWHDAGMKTLRTFGVAIAVLLLPAPTLACVAAKSLEGAVTIPQCDAKAKDAACIPGHVAVYEALEALEIPGEFTIGIQTSPWRMYDGEDRIVTVDEMAASVRSKRPESDKRVRLVGSWTAARPDGEGATLAQRLSAALDGFPVDGSDGFLWLSPKGEMRTTRQAFSVWKTGWYQVRKGDDVMLALVPGAVAQFEDDFARDGRADGVVRAGVGNDVFMLCPEGALAAFERAAGMGSAIGAYNAGVMHAEAGDSAAAIVWLEKAAALGDAKAAARLVAQQKGDGEKSP